MDPHTIGPTGVLRNLVALEVAQSLTLLSPTSGTINCAHILPHPLYVRQQIYVCQISFHIFFEKLYICYRRSPSSGKVRVLGLCRRAQAKCGYLDFAEEH